MTVIHFSHQEVPVYHARGTSGMASLMARASVDGRMELSMMANGVQARIVEIWTVELLHDCLACQVGHLLEVKDVECGTIVVWLGHGICVSICIYIYMIFTTKHI